MHWLIIILGTFILSISLSNPFYKLLIEKRLKLKTFLKIIIRLLFDNFIIFTTDFPVNIYGSRN